VSRPGRSLKRRISSLTFVRIGWLMAGKAPFGNVAPGPCKSADKNYPTCAVRAGLLVQPNRVGWLMVGWLVGSRGGCDNQTTKWRRVSLRRASTPRSSPPRLFDWTGIVWGARRQGPPLSVTWFGAMTAPHNSTQQFPPLTLPSWWWTNRVVSTPRIFE